MLKKTIENKLNATVTINEVIKNNTKLTGVTIRQADEKVTPCIYLESIKDYQNMTTDALADKIIEIYKAHKVADNTFDDFITKLESCDTCADMLTVKLVKTSTNKKLLEKFISRDFLDLSIIPYVVDGDKGVGVTLDLIKKWNVAIDDVIDRAIENIKGNHTVMDMGLPMVILSNKTGVNGASCLLDTDFMNEKCGDNVMYIIPSSIHEVIVADTDMMTVEQADDMIKGVNDSCVDAQDVLSDHVYCYCKEKGLFIPDVA